MKAFVLKEPRRLEPTELKKPSPRGGEVLIKVKMLGICGTDVSVYRGDYRCKDQVILGHEFCGVVEAAGEGVVTCRPGDFVSSAASSGCGRCEWCLAGKPSYCDAARSLGRLVDGALAEFIAVERHMVHPLPPGTTPFEGQGMVGVATALRAVGRSNLRLGDRVLIIGPGYGGLQILQLCKMMGTHVTMAGTRKERLALAGELGADCCVNARETPGWEEQTEKMDVCFEAAGTLSALQSCVRLAKKGATVVEFGTSREIIGGIGQREFYDKELSLVGSKGGNGSYERALALLAAHRVQIEPLVTHVFPFEEAHKALETMDRRLDGVIRAAVRFD